jgi:hypothetical protein
MQIMKNSRYLSFGACFFTLYYMQRWTHVMLVRTSAILRTSEMVAYVWTKRSCGYAVPDLQMGPPHFRNSQGSETQFIILWFACSKDYTNKVLT